MRITDSLLHNQNYMFGKFEREFIYNSYGYRNKKILKCSSSNIIVKLFPLIDRERSYFHAAIFEGKGNRSLSILLSIFYYQVLLIISFFVAGIIRIVEDDFIIIVIGTALFFVCGIVKRKSFFTYIFNRQKILGGIGYLSNKKIREIFPIIQGDKMYYENN